MGKCFSAEKDDNDDQELEKKPKNKPKNEKDEKPAKDDKEKPEKDDADKPATIDFGDDNEDFILNEPIKDKYSLDEEIGKGGFSVVYKAKRAGTNQEYAVKCINKKKVEGDDIRLLKREIRIMKKLNHAHVLKLYEVYEYEDSFYLVMELVKGKELFDKIVQRGMYSERDAAHIISQVLSAVEYLHHNGIAHRDLKPENLLSTGEGDSEIVKIADFGFAKSFAGEEGQILMTSCGSPGYVAPEILTAESYDKSVDMWSVGVIIYILLSGYPPFYADSAPALFKKIMDVKYDFDDSVWDDISDSAKDLIKHLLVKDPNERFTATQCLEHEWIGNASGKKNLKMRANPNKEK